MTVTYKTDSEAPAVDFEHINDGLFFIAASPAARKLRTQAVLLAQVDVPVLIAGEKGSGKKVAAQFIHKLSGRSAGKFVKVDCSGRTREQLDIELFGCDGPEMQPGKLELCQGGTVLLDEIGELPAQLQVKLLRVLQDNQFLRVGGEVPVRVDVRILGTISIEINRALAERKLHEDLYNRLSAFTLHVPALCLRTEEISLLVDYFMHELARAYSLPPRSFSRNMLAACEAHSWPGNLEELRSYVKRYLVIGDEDLAIAELRRSETGNSPRTEPVSDTPPTAGMGKTSGLKSIIQTIKGEAERSAIAAALDQTHWNRKAAAQLLKVSYRTLLYKIEHYHMTPPEYPLTYASNDGPTGSGRNN